MTYATHWQTRSTRPQASSSLGCGLPRAAMTTVSESDSTVTLGSIAKVLRENQDRDSGSRRSESPDHL
jgi:hypothetical protein